MSPPLLSGLLQRQYDQTQRNFIRQLELSRASSLAFDTRKQISSIHKKGITWLDLEQAESRYLLAGGADCSVAIYDVAQPISADSQSSAGGQEYGSALKITTATPGCHQYSISSVAWYPVDTGLFVTGSFDHQVKVWDANLGQVACSFTLPDRVYGIAMSAIAATHCLVAVVGGDPHVKLCDPATGGFTHSLVGHREPVWAVHWSLESEYHLVTGGCDGQVRMWDIRTYNCLRLFDEHVTQKPKPARPESAGSRKRARSAGSRKESTAVAHDGRVTGVLPTPDGLHWLTAGTDNRLRLWDAQHNYHLLVNYQQTFNSSMKARQMAVAGDENIVYHPSGSIIQCLHRLTGQSLGTLRGHLDSVNCCCYNSYQQELYSGGNDCNIIVWAPPALVAEAEEQNHNNDEDAWSD